MPEIVASVSALIKGREMTVVVYREPLLRGRTSEYSAIVRRPDGLPIGAQGKTLRAALDRVLAAAEGPPIRPSILSDLVTR